MANRMKHNFYRCCVGLCFVFSQSLIAQAEIADPTRPAVALPTTVESAEKTAESLVLQSVYISKAEKVAVIGGKEVRVGGKYGASTLISLTEREAVFQGEEGVWRLYLTPGIEKKTIHEIKAASQVVRRKGR